MSEEVLLVKQYTLHTPQVVPSFPCGLYISGNNQGQVYKQVQKARMVARLHVRTVHFLSIDVNVRKCDVVLILVPYIQQHSLKSLCTQLPATSLHL